MSSTDQEIPSHALVFNPMLYYQKPKIGARSRRQTDATPIQVIFPSGKRGLGIPIPLENEVNDANVRDNPSAVILTVPENSDVDQREKMALKVAYLSIALVNFAVVGLLYSEAKVADASKVVSAAKGSNPIFSLVSGHRLAIEKSNFSCMVAVNIIGCVAAVFESPLGLSAYSLGVVLNFLLGTSALPYFIYTFRYLLDLPMLYIALVLRSRLMITFLPVQLPIRRRY